MQGALSEVGVCYTAPAVNTFELPMEEGLGLVRAKFNFFKSFVEIVSFIFIF